MALSLSILFNSLQLIILCIVSDQCLYSLWQAEVGLSDCREGRARGGHQTDRIDG